MKKFLFFIVFGVMLLLITSTAGASDRLDVSKDIPAILASLDQTTVTLLDDEAIVDIRGQAQYTMVKVLGFNTWDKVYPPVTWTWNPFDWRYGNWGGAGYGSGDPVDGMDALFQAHDDGLPDPVLLAGLLALPNTTFGVWGPVYRSNSDSDHYDYMAGVFRISALSYGGRFFWGYRDMPLTEYARRQAVIGAAALSLLP